MSKVQEPAVAGLFYPADPEQLRNQVQTFLREANNPGDGNAPKALIAPHAGYVYSGPVAGNAYVRLIPARERIRRVVLLAPAHRYPFSGLAHSGAEAFRTPLGDIAVDRDALASLSDLAQVRQLPEAFVNEHSLEVHLPFLQETLEAFTLVPLLVGDAAAAEVEEVLERLWGGDETLIVISSDLSHYLEYDTARRLDLQTSAAIEALDPKAIAQEQACGRIPVSGLLLAAKHHGLHARTMDLRSSGDTAGTRNQVVGYGAYAFQ